MGFLSYPVTATRPNYNPVKVVDATIGIQDYAPRAYTTSSFLTAGDSLIGNITFDGQTSSSGYSLYVLETSQFNTWSDKAIQPSSYDYFSGTNVDFIGSKSETVFPINILINTTGKYYFGFFDNSNQLNIPIFNLTEKSTMSYNSSTLKVPQPYTEVGITILSIILAYVLGYQHRSKALEKRRYEGRNDGEQTVAFC